MPRRSKHPTISEPESTHSPAPHVQLDRPLVLVGLMGAGKSAIGRRLSNRLGLPFHDSDDAIESAAGCPIPEIFSRYGEPAFRDVERKVIGRLLTGEAKVLATGGGAFMDPETRATIKQRAITLWLRADLDVLVDRTSRRNNRPLLAKANPREILRDLIEKRHPIYAEADMVVDSSNQPLEVMTDICLRAIAEFQNVKNTG